MQSIRKKISIIIISCVGVSLLLTALFVNITIKRSFDNYIINIQLRRNNRIITYLSQVYKRDNGWKTDSGMELMHEAYMGEYCLRLLDNDKTLIWGMDTRSIKSGSEINSKGLYKSDTFPIKSSNRVVGYVIIGQYSPILMSQEDIDFISYINKTITISVVIALTLTILISLYISKQFSIPIKDVSDISINLSKGNYDVSCSGESNIIELENLRCSINSLGEKLKQQDLLRKRLVSDISHEIRTPLNILQNNLEAMMDGVFPMTYDRMAGLNEEVIRFGKLLDNLNVLKEFESKEFMLDIQRVKIDEILASVIEEFSLMLGEKNINVVTNIDSKYTYEILGDGDKLKQVFINLISNAIKFTFEGGKIWIDMYKLKNNIIIKIKDTGMGIKKRDLPHIFERLYRGDKSRHEIEGTGIGLTIVKRILLLHSGTIEVRSEEKKGTLFIIKIPQKKNLVNRW